MKKNPSSLDVAISCRCRRRGVGGNWAWAIRLLEVSGTCWVVAGITDWQNCTHSPSCGLSSAPCIPIGTKSVAYWMQLRSLSSHCSCSEIKIELRRLGLARCILQTQHRSAETFRFHCAKGRSQWPLSWAFWKKSLAVGLKSHEFQRHGRITTAAEIIQRPSRLFRAHGDGIPI